MVKKPLTLIEDADAPHMDAPTLRWTWAKIMPARFSVLAEIGS